MEQAAIDAEGDNAERRRLTEALFTVTPLTQNPRPPPHFPLFFKIPRLPSPPFLSQGPFPALPPLFSNLYSRWSPLSHSLLCCSLHSPPLPSSPSTRFFPHCRTHSLAE